MSSSNTAGSRHVCEVPNMVDEPDEGQVEETRPFTVLSPGTIVSHYKIIEKSETSHFG